MAPRYVGLRPSNAASEVVIEKYMNNRQGISEVYHGI